ncbi:MAG TPA: hypothetical protein VMC10_13340 [Stellaceae bacterium]|nr:hypothetical protein [Stellaceae bacterium]
MSEIIPDDLQNFILAHFDSIAQLEALLLLRANPRDEWDVDRITARLYTDPREVAAALTRLCEDGFLACANGIYRYQCRDRELQGQVDRLAEAYAKHLIPVTNLIHSKLRRIRQFADAFKFRKDR